MKLSCWCKEIGLKRLIEKPVPIMPNAKISSFERAFLFSEFKLNQFWGKLISFVTVTSSTAWVKLLIILYRDKSLCRTWRSICTLGSSEVSQLYLFTALDASSCKFQDNATLVCPWKISHSTARSLEWETIHLPELKVWTISGVNILMVTEDLWKHIFHMSSPFWWRL